MGTVVGTVSIESEGSVPITESACRRADQGGKDVVQQTSLLFKYVQGTASYKCVNGLITTVQ